MQSKLNSFLLVVHPHSLQNLTLVLTQVPKGTFTSDLKICVPLKKKLNQNNTYKHTEKKAQTKTWHSVVMNGSHSWHTPRCPLFTSTLIGERRLRQKNATPFSPRLYFNLEVKSGQHTVWGCRLTPKRQAQFGWSHWELHGLTPTPRKNGISISLP